MKASVLLLAITLLCICTVSAGTRKDMNGNPISKDNLRLTPVALNPANNRDNFRKASPDSPSRKVRNKYADAGDLTYTTNSDNTITITKYTGGGAVDIPS